MAVGSCTRRVARGRGWRWRSCSRRRRGGATGLAPRRLKRPAPPPSAGEPNSLLEKKRATAAEAKKHSKGSKEFYKNMMAAYEVKAEENEENED